MPLYSVAWSSDTAVEFLTGHLGARFLQIGAISQRCYEMFDNSKFQKLVEGDNLTGEVVAANSFIVEVRGLEGVRLGAQVLFEDGQRGLVREAYGDKVKVFYHIVTHYF